jgi:hypothetical protein
MEADKFSQIDPILDDITEIIQDQFESEQLRQALKTIGDIVGKGRIACFKVVVEVFDEKKETALPYLAMGLISDANGEPYTSWDDSSLQRYVTKDGIVVVPHDRCPGCWEPWDEKLVDTSCGHCGLSMGDNCKLLLDYDCCPWCGEGTVTAANPICSKCNALVDTEHVVWG